MKSYDKKVIISGNVIEVYKYSNSVNYGYQEYKKNSVGGRGSIADEEHKKINREKTCQRASKNLRRIINTNYIKGASRFITLTFKDNVQDLDFANNEFKKFIKRFNYYLGFKLEYSAVIEFQKRGAIHYHCIFYNIKQKLNLPRMYEIWGHGSINVKRISHVDNVGAYMVKYMSKNADDERLIGKKMYFNSRGLKKPTEIKEPTRVAEVEGQLLKQVPKYKNIFENDYNSIEYSQYCLPNKKDIRIPIIAYPTLNINKQAI